MKKQLEWILFAVLTATVIVSFYYQQRVLNYVLLASSIFYLILGWRLFNPDNSSRFDPVYFILSYSISMAFMAFFFKASSYPLEKMMLIGSAAFLALSLILVPVFKKQNRTEPVLRAIVFLILVVLAIIS